MKIETLRWMNDLDPSGKTFQNIRVKRYIVCEVYFCRRCSLTCMTSVCQTTDCYNGRRSWCGQLLSARRPQWRLDADAFRAALLASPLCQSDTWSTLDIDHLARLYDDSITAVLDDILPQRTVVVHRTHGSMMNVAMPNGVFVVLSVQLGRPLQPTLLLHTPPGQLNGAPIATCGARSVNFSGLRKCAARNRVHLSCGGLLMCSWTSFNLCRTPLHGWSSKLSPGPHSAVTVQITLASDARTRLVPAGSASVSLPPRLCTRLPGFRSSAHVTPQCTSTTALFDYISAGRSTHGAFYHWRPHLSNDCCIVWNSLPESLRSSPSLQVFRSRLKTELFARSYRHD